MPGVYIRIMEHLTGMDCSLPAVKKEEGAEPPPTKRRSLALQDDYSFWDKNEERYGQGRVEKRAACN